MPGTHIFPSPRQTDIQVAAPSPGTLLIGNPTSAWSTLLPGDAGYVLTMSGGYPVWAALPTDVVGATVFTELSDVPQSYTDQAGKILVVDVGETALEFTTLSDALAALQQQHIPNPIGGGQPDAEARTAINAILDILEVYGMMATAA